MRSEWQTYKGKRIFFCNYASLDLGALQVEMNEVDDFIGKQPASSVLILTDVRGLVGSPKVVELFTKSSGHTKKFIRRSAVVGIGFSGPKKVLFDIVMRSSGADVTVFDDMEKARDWLVS
jgi:hypothetical protein